jgi:hypothetical protein
MKRILEKIKLQIIFFIARRVRDCKNITPLISESLDRKISLKEKIELKLHFFTCEACVRYLSQIKFLREAIQKQGEQIGDESSSEKKLSDSAKERLKNALRSA